MFCIQTFQLNRIQLNPLNFRQLLPVILLVSAPAISLAQTETELADEIERSMREEMTTKWYPAAINSQRGGFHQTFANDWTPVADSNASLVAQSRHVWTCAEFALHSPQHRSAYTAYAVDGLRFVESAFHDPEFGGLYWAIGADGKPHEAVGFGKHAYGISFAIYAGAKVHELTGDPSALRFASHTFDWLEMHAHDSEHGGYFESFARDGSPILSPKDAALNGQTLDQIGTRFGFKSMNTHIHLLEAFTELTRFDQRPIVRERLVEVFELVRDRIAVAPGVLCLFFTPDWRATAAHDSFGHDIETAYLLVEAAAVLEIPDDERTWTIARSLVDHALEWGWDSEHGGFYDKGEAFSPPLDTDKVWWVQAEGLNALAVMHTRYGHETDAYLNALKQQWRFIRKYSIDGQHGGWHGETDREGNAAPSHKATPWKTNYHTSRALMNTAKLLRSKAAPQHTH